MIPALQLGRKQTVIGVELEDWPSHRDVASRSAQHGCQRGGWRSEAVCFFESWRPDPAVEDSDGNVVFNGRDALHDHYAKLFKAAPDLQAEVVARIRVGSFTIDEQLVTGGPRGDIHAAAVYRVNSDGLIDRVQFLS